MNVQHDRRPSLLVDRALLRNVDTVQELTDILVPYTADALDGRSCESVRLEMTHPADAQVLTGL